MSFLRSKVALAAFSAAVLITGVTVQGSATPASAAPTTFTHPGVMLGRAQLDLMKTKVQAGAEPWKSAYDAMLATKYASLTRTPAPVPTVECGPYSIPDVGCLDEREDSIAAYTDALIWYASGDQRYANKSIEIMDAWSGKITGHANTNSPLQSGWVGAMWSRTAEIIRYSGAGWASDRVTRFATILRTVYLPQVFLNRATYAGNWELTMMEAAVGISVFLEDRTSYDKAVDIYRKRVPAYIYLTADGAYPKAPAGTSIDTPAEIISYWQGQSTFVNGLSQETCRDFEHTGYGIDAISHIAETTLLQGQNLYPEIKDRLQAALELHSRWQLGEPLPTNICGGVKRLQFGPITEVSYNALHNRMGISLPNTELLTQQQRPAGTNILFVAWETLTNAGDPGVPPVEPPAAVFTHPGVMLGRTQLDLMKTKVQAGAEPWKSAYASMLGSTYASLTRTPVPRATVECGPYSVPDLGCADERKDSLAAYTDALAWYISGDQRYANKAIEIMDAWSGTIQDHTNTNAPLQAAWAGSSWARAAEIIRYSGAGWPTDRITRFSTMLRNVHLPQLFVDKATTGGSWELRMMEAAVGISVFLDDKTNYDKAVAIYRKRVPAFIYLTTDGAYPKGPAGTSIDTKAEIISYWQGQSTFVNGLTQETCQDFTSAGYGISAISHTAETTLLQGQDLYPELKDRLRYALGLHSGYQLGNAMPSNICGGKKTGNLGPITEVGYNALHNRLGISMPNTQLLTEKQRPAGTNDLSVAWETLTNAGG
jgi:Alginate lyase